MEADSVLRDKDKRRAAMLSVVLHLVAVLLLVWASVRPAPPEPETFLVIDLGQPELQETPIEAPTVDAPAPQAQESQVADPDSGVPQARASTQVEPAAPEPQPRTLQPPTLSPPPPPAPAPPAPTQAETPPPPPAPAAPPEPADAVAAQTPPQQAPPAPPEPPQPPESQEQAADQPRPPTPQVRAPQPRTAAELPTAQAPSTQLPEIDEVELEPRPAAQAIIIPRPTPSASVPEARVITATPTVTVAQEQAIPQPQVEASVASPVEVPTPQVQASVAEQRSVAVAPSVTVAQERAIPQPRIEASVASPVEVPTPQVQASVAPPVEVPTPQVQASVAEQRSVAVAPSVTVAQEQAIPQPQVEASVASPVEVPTPQVQASVAAEVALPQPQVEATVTPAREVPLPSVEATVAQPRALAVEPQLEVASPQPVPAPQVRADVAAPAVVPGAPSEGEAPEGTAATASARTDGGDPGGNAVRPGQTAAVDGASPDNLGAAAAPDGSEEATGAPLLVPDSPFEQSRERPLAVLLDNANGYPQAGLLEASWIAEMPVEGGLTRLMTVYDHTDPAQVGPIRSARDYFLELAQSIDGILVHDGGSPGALAAISRSDLPTFNAFSRGELFSRQAGRSAPYNLYAQGSALREAVTRLSLGENRAIRGMVYLPSEEADSATQIRVRYSSVYSSGFTYVRDLNLYRWFRNGESASDAFGEAVYVDAVLVATINVRPLPDDPEGRLYIPLRDDSATLFLRGRAIPGTWSKGDGIVFTSETGEVIDLAPFKLWMLFTPTYAEVNVD